jgi:hypothetical protein
MSRHASKRVPGTETRAIIPAVLARWLVPRRALVQATHTASRAQVKNHQLRPSVSLVL